jgi:glycerophosphoryl diester phosphodiesterase
VLNHKKTEIHGHRGCRAYFPENTLPGFIRALGLNCDAIEMDVVISKDHQVVVSHEHFMHYKKCLGPSLKKITKEEEQSLFLYQMDYDMIKDFDCGLLPHPTFPLVKNMPAYKPLLIEVIEKVEMACLNSGRKPITYNIEIKSELAFVGKAQPNYETYVGLVLEVVYKFKIENRVIIQSFDKEILRTIKKNYPNVMLSLLIEDDIDPFIHINELGFTPTILASEYTYLKDKAIFKLQDQKIKVFAFTVNKIKSINEMLAFGVDAIITDYPDIAAQCAKSYIYPEK